MGKRERTINTQMATLTKDTITVRGFDLVGDLIGEIDVGDLFFLEVTGRKPNRAESRLINALIVSVAEHGMMPSVIAARLTLLGAPESVQGAVASGLLGAGDNFVGPGGNVARMLQVEAAALKGTTEERAAAIVESYIAEGRRIPGLGQPHHPVDPRCEKLLALQRETDLPRGNAELMTAIHALAVKRLDKPLPMNAVAAIGAIASDIGIDWRAVRGIGLVGRAVGLVGHVLEEMKQPSAQAIWDLVQENTRYSDPEA